MGKKEAPVAIFDGALAYKLHDDLRKKMPRLIESEDLYSGRSTVKALPAAMETVAGRFYELIEQ